MILILGVGSILFIGMIMANVLHTPKLNRFFTIRTTIAAKESIPEEGIRLPLKSGGSGATIFTFDLAYLPARDSGYLESLAGRVFELEDRLVEEATGTDAKQSFFRRVQFVEEGQRPLAIERRVWAARASVHEAVAPDGDARRRACAALGQKPDALEMAMDETEPLSPRVGIRITLPAGGDRDADLEKAARGSAAVFEVLSAKIRYVRIDFVPKAGGSAWSALAPTTGYIKERRRVGDPSKIEWKRVIQVRETP